MSRKNNNDKTTWQELEREEKHYKDDRNSNRDRVKRPYKRERTQGHWWEEALEDDDNGTEDQQD